MTPTKEMIEAAARAIYEYGDDAAMWEEEVAPYWREEYMGQATAALSAVLPMVRAAVVEECAKVAEAHNAGYIVSRDEIASAIRALSPDSEAAR